MNVTLLGASLILFGSTLSSLTQVASGKIDLETKSSNFLEVVGGGILYKPSLGRCPEVQWQLATSHGDLFLVSHKDYDSNVDYVVKEPNSVDEQTFQLIVENKDCRFVVKLRKQQRENDIWRYLKIKNTSDVSLPAQMTNEKLFGNARSARSTQEHSEQIGESFITGDVHASARLRFNDTIATCMEMFVNFMLFQNSLKFYLPTGLGVELNRISLERSDIDNTQSRLFLSKGNCRYELNIEYAYFSNGAWINRSVETELIRIKNSEPQKLTTPGN